MSSNVEKQDPYDPLTEIFSRLERDYIEERCTDRLLAEAFDLAAYGTLRFYEQDRADILYKLISAYHRENQYLLNKLMKYSAVFGTEPIMRMGKE